MERERARERARERGCGMYHGHDANVEGDAAVDQDPDRHLRHGVTRKGGAVTQNPKRTLHHNTDRHPRQQLHVRVEQVGRTQLFSMLGPGSEG
jgi:hypothetical protein